MDKFTVEYGGTSFQDTVGYDLCKIFEDLFLLADTARTGCWKGFKVRPFARFARALGTKKRRRKFSKRCFQEQVLHPTGASISDRPWGSSLTGNVQ